MNDTGVIDSINYSTEAIQCDPGPHLSVNFSKLRFIVYLKAE